MIEPNGDFVETWLSSRKSEAELDQDVLLLVDKCREGSTLDEKGLLKSLIALSDALEDEDGSD